MVEGDFSILSRRRNIEVIYNHAKNSIYPDYSKKNQKEQDIIEDILQQLNTAYALMKQLFANKKRDSGERYFEHLREVANIIIKELDNPSVDKVLIALLHDSIEDLDVDFDMLKRLFSNEVALGVQALSKEPWENYLDEEETIKYNGLSSQLYSSPDISIKNIVEIMEEIGKGRRNKEYFSHLESFDKMKEHISNIAKENSITLSDIELNEITFDTLDVKFADRIHNLRTQWDPNDIEKVERKVDETKKYFLNVAKQTNKKAYSILQHLIFVLKNKLMGVKKSTNNIIEIK